MSKGGSPEQYIPGCRNSVAPQFRACVAKLIGASGFKQNTIDEVKPAAPPSSSARVAGARARSVAPRSIADITAILDQELGAIYAQAGRIGHKGLRIVVVAHAAGPYQHHVAMLQLDALQVQRIAQVLAANAVIIWQLL